MEHRLDRLVVRRTRPGRRRLGWLAVAVAADALGLGYGVHALYVRATGTVYIQLVVPWTSGRPLTLRLSDHHAPAELGCPSFVLSGDVVRDRRIVRRWLKHHAARGGAR